MCFCVFSSGVLGTVCGAIGLRRGSQSGFGNGLRGNWASERVAKCSVLERSAGQLGFRGGRKVVCVLRVLERLQGTVCGVIGNFARGVRGGFEGGAALAKRCFSGFWDRVLERFFLASYLMNGEI